MTGTIDARFSAAFHQPGMKGRLGMDLQEHVVWLSRQPRVQDIWRYLDKVLADILASAVLIQQIPAPTFRELVRANHVLSCFGSCGLVDTGIDNLYNVYGRLPGKDPSAPALLISAHTDTVFPEGTDLALRHENGSRIAGPGIGDNSLGVAALVAIADIMRQFRVKPHRDIWFLANSREEGLGDLSGIRAFYEQYGHRLGRAIVIEGLTLGRVYHRGIAVRRLHVATYAEGGHSWQQFGRPSAIHHLLLLGARLVQLKPPEKPRTTYNIGIIQGGQSVNSLATSASFYMDLRSEDPQTLRELETTVRGIIASESDRVEGISVTVDVVGDRPSGGISADHELVRGAAAALQVVDLDCQLQAGSTDANLLLDRGLPAVTIGLTTGGNTHRLDEYINTEPLVKGMRQLILLALAGAGWEPPPEL